MKESIYKSYDELQLFPIRKSGTPAKPNAVVLLGKGGAAE